MRHFYPHITLLMLSTISKSQPLRDKHDESNNVSY